jgi:hypothetical protein
MDWGPWLIFAAVLTVEALWVWSCAGIARAKGYNPWVWGILAFFFFGVVILVILVLLPRRVAQDDLG